MASKSNTSPDLLGGLTEDGSTEVAIDLLDELTEEEGENWIPENAGDGIQGTVLSVTTFKGEVIDQKTGTFPDIPLIALKDPAGTTWLIRAYHSILRTEVLQANPQPGDLFAVKYFGKKEPRKPGGNPYHLYKVAVRPGPRPAATAATTSKPPF